VQGFGVRNTGVCRMRLLLQTFQRRKHCKNLTKFLLQTHLERSQLQLFWSSLDVLQAIPALHGLHLLLGPLLQPLNLIFVLQVPTQRLSVPGPYIARETNPRRRIDIMRSAYM